MKLKENDFVELEYTGKIKDDNSVFDTTDEVIAKEAGINRENVTFGPVVVCLGQGHILKGIEDELIGKEPGSFDIELSAEKAFGKKDAKLLKLMPTRVFANEKISPFPGLEVNIDNMYGIVRAVSGGRVIVDFNHPLSGRDVKYHVKVNKIVESPAEKFQALMKNEFKLGLKCEFEDGLVKIDEILPEELVKVIKERAMKIIPEIKDIVLKPTKKEEVKKETKSGEQ